MGQEPDPGRVLLKLSGDAFSAGGPDVFDSRALEFIAAELGRTVEAGVQVAVVIGGGNIMRGAKFCPDGPGRIGADYAGMLATVINGVVLRDCLLQQGVAASHYSAFRISHMVDDFEPERCVADLEEGRIVLLSGGTGNPFFTTDTAAALRAVEIGADLLLKATRVDGVYSADPETNPDAEFFEAIRYDEVLERKLAVMDLTAVSLCLVNGLPVRIFNFAVEGNIRRAALGESIGTLIGGSEDAR